MLSQTQDEQEQSSATSRSEMRGNPRARALVIGALGAAATGVLVTQAEMVLSSVRIGYLQFPPVALGLLLIAVALGRGVQRMRSRWGLSSSDLLVIYCMALVAAMVSSHGIAQKFTPMLIAPKYFQTANNNWHGLYDPNIPHRLVPYDPSDSGKQAVTEQYYGKTPRGQAIPWQPWIIPLLNWGILIFLILFAFVCLATIMRRQWVDNEKLSFPLAQLPLEIAGDQETGGSFFTNRLMWLGALIPIVVYGIKSLHQVMPSVPDINLSISVNDYLTVPPWNRLSYTALIVSFAAIGFFYLLPADVLFSIWFFFLLTRIEQLVAIAYNMDTPGMPIYPPPMFVGYQTVGAYLVLSGYFFWIARPHLRRVWAAAIGREKADDSNELMPYRVAVWGLFGSILASALWLWSIGMSPWLALFELGIFIFVTAMVMARSTAEAGMLMTETTFRPIDLYRMVAPIHALGAQNLTALMLFDNIFLRDQRGLLLTGLLDSLRIADGTRIRRRAFFGVLSLGVMIALVVSVGLNIYLPYHMGGTRLDSWMEQGSTVYTLNDYQPYFLPGVSPVAGDAWQMPVFFGVGVVVTILLTLLRASFFWWPLHPLGYALSGSWSTVEFWFPCLIAWIFKSLSLRYGGMSFYAKARPFFLGLVLGEFSMAVLAVLMNIAFNIPPPAFPWG